MTPDPSTHEKPLHWRRFEFALLALCLFIIVLRTTHTESSISTMNLTAGILSGAGWSMVISGSLILAAILWFAVSLTAKKISYKASGIEIPAALFIVAGIVAVFFASNKRDAINNMVSIAGALAISILLVQLLNSQRRIRLLLMVIVAAGAINCYQSAHQFFISNDMMISEYEEDPEIQLSRMNIEPGSFQHASYEHRLYSKDVKGFFTTGNSAASFALLALAAAAVQFISEMRNTAKGKIRNRNLGIYAAFMAVIIFSLLLTHSKGGIAASILAAALFGLCAVLWKLPKKYVKILVIAGVIFAVVGIAAICAYGIKHDGLPGGNSMLVRWQYWKSAVSMYADNKLTGVGGGNFGTIYTQYKNPAASETIRDPHCFPLSILAQYGLLGLIGFIAAFAIPMLKAAFYDKKPLETNPSENNAASFKCGAIVGVFITIGLIFARRIIMAEYEGKNLEEAVFIIFYIYVSVATIFGTSFLFMWIAARERAMKQMLFGSLERTVIVCALAGVIAHNLVDYAIFEPGVLTGFFSLIACVTAMSTNTSTRQVRTFQLPKPARVCGVAICVIFATAFMRLALVPTVKVDSLKQQAMAQYDRAHEFLSKAADTDPLNPEPYNISGRLYLKQFTEGFGKDPSLLEKGANMLNTAAFMDPENFKNYEKLSQVHKLWAETLINGKPDDANEKLQTACDYGKRAVELYPGSGRLWYQLAEIEEKLELQKDAGESYRKAVDIEDAYQEQFKIMYPGRDMVSRLGNYKYQQAKEKQ